MANKLRIGVVGGTGLVGRHIVEALAKAGVESIVATYRARPAFAMEGVRWVRCDLREPGSARPVLDAVDIAVLCAGRLSTSSVLRADPVASVVDTLRIATNVLEVAADLRVPRVILISSCTGYPALPTAAVEADMLREDPPPHWFGVGWMHRYVEIQLRWYSENLGRIGSAISLRPSLVYGPHDDFDPQTGHFVPTMIRKVVDRVRPIEVWGDGAQSRNLLHASDLAAAVLTVLRGEMPYEAFNVTSQDDVTVDGLLEHLIEIDGFTDAVVKHDREHAASAMALSVSGEAFSRAKEWTSRIGFREGVTETLEWYRRNRTSAA